MQERVPEKAAPRRRGARGAERMQHTRCALATAPAASTALEVPHPPVIKTQEIPSGSKHKDQHQNSQSYPSEGENRENYFIRVLS